MKLNVGLGYRRIQLGIVCGEYPLSGICVQDGFEHQEVIVRNHIFPRPGLVALVASFLLMLVGLAGTADAQIQPPVCPSKECSKVITFYNNTPTAIFPVIQAGIQNPHPWLQALFNDDAKTYAETHYSRVYINPVNGIPPGGHVSVTVP